MRGKVLSLAMLSVLMLGGTMCTAQEFIRDKELFNPDVVTLWHRLGIPQGLGRYRRFRDSRINRDGLSPDKERKPKLLRLADPKNLEAEAPELLKTAAKIKIDQDLAPQKIKALRYICSVGCSCYDKKLAGLVTKAVVEGLGDCVVDVRKAAIQVILANASSGCGCDAGGFCETCCSEDVRKMLEEMLKMDDKGCYNEPNEEVRALAEQALNTCPPPAPKKKEEEEKDDKVKRLEGGDDSAIDVPESLEAPTPDDGQTRSSRRRTNPYQQVATRNSFGSAWNDPALAQLNIKGVIESLEFTKSDALIMFDQPYEFPTGSQIVIALDENHVSMGSILVSETGKALIHIDDSRLTDVLKTSTRVRLGVLEN